MGKPVENIEVELAPKMCELFEGDFFVRVAYGGRGSTKTRGFALKCAIDAYTFASHGISGQIVCAREILNSLEESSMEEIKTAIRETPWLRPHFDIGEKYIRTKCRRVRFTFAGLRHNVDSIKSRARILRMWVDEAEKVSKLSWDKVLPTLREEGEEDIGGGPGWHAELYVSYNPESDMSETHKRFRENPDPDTKVIEINFRDNPWFPDILNRQRINDKEQRPDDYDWIWEGAMRTNMEGAYFAKAMAKADQEGRICAIPFERALRTYTFWDLGVSDDMTVIVVQPFGKEIRIVSAYSNSGYGMDHYVDWLDDLQQQHKFRWAETNAHHAPHDINVRDLITGKTRQEIADRKLGIQFEMIDQVSRKQLSIDAARDILPRVWFNKQDEGVQFVIKALRWYHREYDDQRQAFRQKPEHDWSSNPADAVQQMAMAWDEKFAEAKRKKLAAASRRAAGSRGSWMGG